MAPVPTGVALCMAWPRSLEKPRRISQREGAGSGKGRIFPQRMARHEARRVANGDAMLGLQHADHRHGDGHQRGLGVFGERQVGLGPLPHQG